ncbi:hypothetical protein XELAEV_18010136mg [Xenopus laevis]|uniref:Uncharacterized protein n=1 Tax=Xenopus laevis TaxID=8355 RepID=A0A974I1E7_XENLA|nr:hypothetical protein XELAEV_18010136mg [Xenopus laevis]
MTVPRLRGGLGVPDFGKYLQASQLSSILLLYANPPPKWVTMEESLIQPVKLSAVPWVSNVTRPDNLTPMLEQALLIWNKIKYKRKLS